MTEALGRRTLVLVKVFGKEILSRPPVEGHDNFLSPGLCD